MWTMLEEPPYEKALQRYLQLVVGQDPAIHLGETVDPPGIEVVQETADVSHVVGDGQLGKPLELQLLSES